MARALQNSSVVVRMRQRGFTLIEMMIVVVIVGILAMLAVVGYRRLVSASHVTEARNTVQSIRVAQEAYHAETQRYADISTSLSAWYPQSTPTGHLVTAWGGACTVCMANMDWSVLPLHIDGPVLFGYATKAGTSVDSLPTLPSDITGKVTLPGSPTTDWYVVTAMCDLDANGSPYSYVMTTSFSNQVFAFNEGN
jgi:type IV pilus assembly protein PilA